MDTPQHIDALVAHTDRLAAALVASDLERTVTTCPDWRVRDLTEHVGHLHRWATKVVGERIGTPVWPMQVQFEKPGGDADAAAWGAWLRDGAAAAAELFAATPPATRVWGWGADQHARFWPRRMLFETVVHLLDLDVTEGRGLVIDPVVAIDGIDEHLDNLRFVAQWQPALVRLGGTGERVGLRATDADASWRVRLADSGWWWDRGSGKEDAALAGPVAELLFVLQGRPAPGVERSGDTAVLDRWQNATAF